MWRHSACKNPDIIHEALDHVLIFIIRITGHGKASLPSNFSGGYFDLEFVFEILRRL